MEIKILCENSTGYAGSKVCLAEWGFSVFIKAKGANILFDSGHTGIYKQNAERLDIDLENTDFVVLSHHHWDHVGGIGKHGFKGKKKLVLHPDLLNKLSLENAEKMKSDFELVFSKKRLEISKDIYYLGEIPRKNKFEKGEYKGDKMLDDSAIAIKTSKGVVVISGCSHSGICNICEYAKEVTGQGLHAVVGGFHLFENDQEAVDGTIEYFKKEKAEYLYPMHCVDFPTLSKLHSIFEIQKLSTGDTIVLDD